jgi:hypothetical protein
MPGAVEIFWGWIRNVLAGSKDQPQPETMNEKIWALANGIDACFDNLLYPGMQVEDAVRLEQQRAAPPNSHRR